MGLGTWDMGHGMEQADQTDMTWSRGATRRNNRATEPVGNGLVGSE